MTNARHLQKHLATAAQTLFPPQTGRRAFKGKATSDCAITKYLS